MTLVNAYVVPHMGMVLYLGMLLYCLKCALSVVKMTGLMIRRWGLSPCAAKPYPYSCECAAFGGTGLFTGLRP